MSSSSAPVGATCEGCAWRYVGGRGRPVARCRVQGGVRLAAGRPACTSFEPPLDCQACAACCREAYHSVTVPRRDPALRLHPELAVVRDGYVELRRAGGRCAALAGPSEGPWACTIYDERPVRPCREFQAGSENCLIARRRVGLGPR